MTRSKKNAGARTVLVISDDCQAIDDIKQVFELCEPKTLVKTADGSCNIKHLVKTLQPHAIVLDLGISDIDGFDVIADIRQISEAALVTLSYTRDQSILVKALEMGADGHMTKPIHQLEFIARVRSILRRKEITCQTLKV